MAVDLMTWLRQVAAQVAHLWKYAAMKADVPTYAWATVATVGPPATVILEHDESGSPRAVSANSVGYLEVGWRVRVECVRNRLTIIAAPQQVAALQAQISALERKASGTVTVSVNASAGGTAAVTFPPGRFTAADVLNVQLTKANSRLAKYTVYATAISATGMTVGVYSGDGTTTTASVVIHWRVEVAS